MDRVPPLRVLCVDDNADIADSEAELLRLVGFEARSCHSGPDALAAAATFRPSVGLIDFHMPGMNGDEVAVRLREQAAGAPLVLVAVTAMSGDEVRRRLEEAGFDIHLVKPVDPHSLIAIVDQLWRAWEAALSRTDPGDVRTSPQPGARCSSPS